MTKHRKTRCRYETPGEARYLTCSCFHRLQLFSNDRIKEAFLETFDAARQRKHFKLYAWVIMPEHVHLLIEPSLPDFPISKVLKDIKGNFANRVLRRWRELNADILKKLRDSAGKEHFWQAGGGYDTNIYSEAKLLEKIDYTHDNPVRRGLVTRQVDWVWSSARWYSDEFDNVDALIEIDPLPF